MIDELLKLLSAKRLRLNATIALHRALAYAGPTALATGLLVALLRVLGFEGSGFALWAGLCALGAAVGAFVARGSLVDETDTARWLDSRLDDQELLSAALVCARREARRETRRESPCRFDAAILERAALVVPQASAQKPPIRPIATKAAIAAICLAIGAYAVFLSAYTATSRQGGPGQASKGSKQPRNPESSAVFQALDEGGKAASDFAASIFPEDKRMATLVERALREGRIDDLRDLIKAKGLEIDSKLSRSVEEMERKRLTRNRDLLDEASRALASASRSQGSGDRGEGRGGDSQGEAGSKSDRSGRPNQDKQGQDNEGGSGQYGSRARSPLGGQGSIEGEGEEQAGSAGSSDSDSGSQAKRGGSGYGVGSGDAGDWGKIKPEAGSDKATITVSPKSSFFEFVLPGSDAAAQVSDLASSSRKMAEAAMSHEELPLEHEDFVKSYFMALSQGQRP